MLDGVTLVSGGGGGLGRAVARRVVAAGGRVALLGRTAEAVDAAAAALGAAATAVVADVASRPEVERAVSEVTSRWGAPTALVNAAGIAESAPLLPPDDALWARTLAVNATGCWHLATACLPGFLSAGRGAIVNVASTAAVRGYRYVAAYVASKHAVLGLTRALAEDLRDKGITVNAVCPGFLDTPMTERTVARIVASTGRAREAVRGEIALMNASGRLVTPDAVAAVVLELLGDPGRTGEAIVIE